MPARAGLWDKNTPVCPGGRDTCVPHSQQVWEPCCHGLLLKKGCSPKCATSANSASCPFFMCLSLHISFNYFLLPPRLKTGPFSFIVPKHRVCHLWQHVRRFCAKRQTKALQWLCHSTLPHVSIYTKYSMVCSLPSWGRVLP